MDCLDKDFMFIYRRVRLRIKLKSSVKFKPSSRYFNQIEHISSFHCMLQFQDVYGKIVNGAFVKVTLPGLVL